MKTGDHSELSELVKQPFKKYETKNGTVCLSKSDFEYIVAYFLELKRWRDDLISR